MIAITVNAMKLLTNNPVKFLRLRLCQTRQRRSIVIVGHSIDLR